MNIKTAKYFKKLSNPLLFYTDKKEYSIFKNFCLFEQDGNMYNRVISAQDAGKALDYRLCLNKYLRIYTIFISIFVYLLFIHTICNIEGLILYELLWIFLYFSGRMLCSELYKNKLTALYGKYEVTDFNPPITSSKADTYKREFIIKTFVLVVSICVLAAPAFFVQNLIKYNLNKKQPNFSAANTLSNIYTVIYPQTPFILETRAIADYVSGDYKKASQNYINAIKMKGKYFSSKDYIKFANLLYLIKKSDGSQYAVDIFNELVTNKKLSVGQQTKLLWIKSIFSISNGVSEFVMNDYDDLIASLSKKDKREEFYIMSDKAYMLYLMGNYRSAIAIYNSLIEYAKSNQKLYDKDLSKLYVERGFTKRRLKDYLGANEDFLQSKINLYNIKNYEPKTVEQGFIFEKF